MITQLAQKLETRYADTDGLLPVGFEREIIVLCNSDWGIVKTFGFNRIPSLKAGSNVSDLLQWCHPESVETFNKIKNKAAAKPRNIQVRVRDSEDEYIPVNFRIQALKDEGKLHGFIIKITELSSAEKEYTTLVSILNHSLFATAALNPVFRKNGSIEDFRFYFVNGKVSEQLSTPLRKLKGKKLKESIPWFTQTGLYDKLLEVYNSGHPHNQIYNFKSGLEGSHQVVIFRFEGGVVIRFASAEEIESDILHKEFYGIYKEFSDDAPLMMLKVGNDANIIYANSLSGKVYAKRISDIVGLPLNDLIHESYRRKLREKIDEIRASDVNQIEFESMITDKDGNDHWISWIMQPVRGADLELIGLNLYGHDVTKQRELSEEAKREKDEVIYWKDFYEDILDGIETEIVVFDLEHRYLYVNPVAVKDPEMRNWLLGRDDFDYCKKRGKGFELARQRRGYFNKVLADKTTWTWEEVNTRKDGSQQIMLRALMPGFSSSKKIRYVIGYSVDITRMKLIEKRLKQQQVFLRNIIDANPGIIFVKSEDGTYILANQALANIYNTTVENIIGKSDAELVTDKKTVERFQNRDSEVLRTGKATGYYHDLLPNPNTGDDKWYEINKVPLTDSSGARRILGVAFDITERLEAEKLLKESEKRYRSVVDNVKEVIFQTDIEGNWTFLNPAWEEISGFKPEECYGKSFTDYIHKDDAPKVFELLKQFFKGEADFIRDEIRYVASDGKIRWVEFFVNPAWNNSGRITGFSGTINDITERRLAAEERQKFASMVENSTDIILIAGLDGSINYMNPSGMNALGINPGLPEQSVRLNDLFDESSREKIESVFGTGVQKRTSWNGESKIINKKNGDRTDVSCSLFQVIHPETDEVYCYACVMKDISEKNIYLRALEEEKKKAEDANRAKTEFLANVSHEIRTPMNAVLGFTDLLMDMIEGEQELKFLDAISVSGKNLLMLINDILDLSKIESGRLDLEYEASSLRKLVDDIEQMFRAQLHDSDLEYTIEYDDNIPEKLMIDQVRLRQILVNLVGNAIKFTDVGFVNVYVRQVDFDEKAGTSDLLISVEDSGIGIPDEQQELIFESFRQQSGQSNRKYGGTGLGLTICRKLIRKMGGEISVESEPGRGSRFDIHIPAVQIAGSKTEIRETTAAALSVTFNGGTVLVVDDILLNRHLICQYLKDSGLNILEAENGEVALRELRENEVDLVIMDIKMPVMDGYEATKAIKNDPKLKHIPVIALTASVFTSVDDKINEIGFEGFMRKPVSKNEILQELKKQNVFEVLSESGTDGEPSEPVQTGKGLSEENYAGLMEQLREEFLPEISDLTATLVPDEVADFADRMKQLAQKEGSNEITHAAQSLKQSAEAYDVEGMLRKLKSFSELLENVS